MKELLKDVTERAARYLVEAERRRVWPSAESVAALNAFRTPMPTDPEEPLALVERLDTLGAPGTVATAGPRYFGFVIGGTLPAALASNWLSTAWDQNAGMFSGSPVSSVLEEVALGWLVELLGLPSDVYGTFTTGATMANFTCLAAARQKVLADAGWDANGDGLFGAPPITVIVGEQAHVTLHKALGMLGLGRKRVVRVPCDEQGRIRVDLLPPIAGPTIVCIQAGEVNTGAFDDAEAVVEHVRGRGWIHVDGAFGLWALACPSRRTQTRGLNAVDSWATDGHKWLNLAYDCGVALVRHPDALKTAMYVSAPYLVGRARDGMDYSPESSRRARGIEAWAALASIGKTGLVDLIERCSMFARRFAAGLTEAGYEILNEVVLNQVLVSFGTNEQTQAVIAGIQEDGTCWCGGTTWRGRSAMRISVSSWATTDQDVDESLAAMVRVARSVVA